MSIDTAALQPLPAAFQITVANLHRVAAEIVSPARKPDNEIALIATPGGFGTPVFDDGGVPSQVRVEGAELVFRAGEAERREALDVDPVAAARLAGLYAFAAAILGTLATPVWLWPAHFG